MNFCLPVSGHQTNTTPKELHAACVNLTPLLPNQVSLWGLNLATQFHDALSPSTVAGAKDQLSHLQSGALMLSPF
jgi:hypothetical protein